MEQQTKYFIVGTHAANKHKIAAYIEQSIPNKFKTGRLTTQDSKYKRGGQYRYYSEDEIKEIFDNKEFIFLHDGFGLMKSTYDELNLFVVSIDDFLLIPNKIWQNNDNLIIWIDTTKDERKKNYDEKIYPGYDLDSMENYQMILSNQFIQSLSNKNVMYFKDATPIEIISKLVQYIEEENPAKRRKLLTSEF